MLAIAFQTGCALAPGMKARDIKSKEHEGHSDLKLLEKITVKEVTPKLIRAIRNTQKLKAPLNVSSDILLDKEYTYRVGVGDVISVVVWDHPDLTIPAGAYRSAEDSGYQVLESGDIFFPYAGMVPVSGKTVEEIRQLLSYELEKTINNVQLNVRVVSYRSKRVHVVGAVGTPGIHTISDISPTIIDLVNSAGGFTENSDRRNIHLTRSGKSYTIDLLGLYEQGYSDRRISIQDGDVIRVGDRSSNKVFLLGEIEQPGSYIMHDEHRLSLAEAISDAGSIKQNTSDSGQVYVIRHGDSSEPEVYHIDMSSPSAMILADNFTLKKRDVIYVDAASIVRWNRVLSNLLSSLQLIYLKNQFN